ncbi:MAG TPA: CBS domain-containing protein [Burkholderiales bacterium]|nr:CBS domain-containing protein [Burkholderiales bacterium]
METPWPRRFAAVTFDGMARMDDRQTNSAYGNEQLRRRLLISEIRRRDSRDAAKLLTDELPNVAGQVLLEVSPGQTTAILERLTEDFVARVLSSVPAEYARQWARNQAYPDGSIGRMMDPAIAVFPPHISVAEAIERLRSMIKTAFVTYGFVTDESGRLTGLITMRDLLFGAHGKKLGFDPATASSIFLTTATDIASMGCFLGLATLLIL